MVLVTVWILLEQQRSINFK